jgi:hypothetical protein
LYKNGIFSRIYLHISKKSSTFAADLRRYCGESLFYSPQKCGDKALYSPHNKQKQREKYE